MSKDFHQRCDYHKDTVALFKLAQDGPCIGGFTRKYWSYPSETLFLDDPSSFLFNLRDDIKFPVVDSSKAIMCDKDYGPCFGNKGDLMTRYQPFNKVNGCKSATGSASYGIGMDDDEVNMLSRSDEDCFTI